VSRVLDRTVASIGKTVGTGRPARPSRRDPYFSQNKKKFISRGNTLIERPKYRKDLEMNSIL